MSVFARMIDGEPVQLSPKLGSTAEEVVQGLTTHSMTGSAVQFLETADGRFVRYDHVVKVWSGPDPSEKETSVDWPDRTA